MELQAIIENTGWLFAEKISRTCIGLFVGIWIARYLGPEQYGSWSYAIAFTALFGAVAALGLDGIVVRELVKDPARRDEILGTAFILKAIGGMAALLVTVGAAALVRNGETHAIWLVGICALGFIFQSLNIIDFYFQAKVQSRYTVWAGSAAFFLVTLIKISLLLVEAPLIAFVWTGVGEIALTGFFLVLAFRINHHNVRAWTYDMRTARALLTQSWPFIISGAAVMLYMRIDQIMVGQIIGDKAVGLYSAAIRISEVWYFMPVAIVGSVFPSIIDARKESHALYCRRLQKLYNIMALLSIAFAIPMTFLANSIVEFLFGQEYRLSGPVLAVSVWCGLFASLSVASGKWFIVEGHATLALRRNLCGVVLNVALNYYLIPIYGIVGAAVATLLSFSLAAYFSDLFSRSTRVMFRQKTKAIFLYEVLRFLLLRRATA